LLRRAFDLRANRLTPAGFKVVISEILTPTTTSSTFHVLLGVRRRKGCAYPLHRTLLTPHHPRRTNQRPNLHQRRRNGVQVTETFGELDRLTA